MTARPASPVRPVRSWPLVLLAAPAFVAIWSGWVGLGRLTGFGPVEPLPGILDGFVIDTAVTLPIGVEAYAAYALRAWLSDDLPERARTFARCSALGSLVLGASGQVAYHLLAAAGVTAAPWWITAAVACLPVAVLGMGATLAHLVHEGMPAAPAYEAAPSTVAPEAASTALDEASGHAPDVSDLLVVGQAVAAELARDGRTVTRASLLAGIRRRGHRCSTERAQALLSAVRGLERTA